ncbi:MAG: response regulator transcription factor [Clostridiales bacterium]|nr:response regulator transcription factor [Clostridiales bacterium]MDD7034797.1 response regulator transcription factor [Bacillota bacterium]MDY2921050.1 response regulator transcription factor [Lentihominibacter sp.]
MNDKIRIYLADDHKILRESLIMLLSQEDDIEIAGNASDGIETTKEIYELDGRVDILLMDIAMPRKGGFDTAREIRDSFPDIRIIFLTMYKNEEMLAEAFENGASGYVLKENAFEELVTAIHQVMSGEIYISTVMAPLLLSGFLQNEKNNRDLSGREREVLKLLAEGYSNREIAEFLSISVKTVETHRANIMKKHNFKNITELVLYAVRNHIIEV